MAIDFARQHASACIGPEIGFEKRLRDVERRARLDGQRKIRKQLAYLVQMAFVEAFRRIGGAGKEDSLHQIGPVALGIEQLRWIALLCFTERDQACGVVGHAGLPQIFENRKVDGAAGIEPAAQRDFVGIAQPIDRAFQVAIAHPLGPAWMELGRKTLVAPPHVAMRTVARVQRTDRHVEATRAEAGLGHVAAKRINLLRNGQSLQAAFHERGRETR